MAKQLLFVLVLVLAFAALAADDFYDLDRVNTIRLYFTQSNWDQLLDNLYAAGDEERLLGTAVINGVTYDSVGVRYKGNSSYSASRVKNPFNIKLDYVIDDQLLDGKYGTIKLANGYMDPSMVREVLSYEIARKYMPAGLANFAVVYVNDTLIGVYTSVQDVDSYFISSNLNCSGKPRIKAEHDQPTLTTIWGYSGADSSSYTSYYELDTDTGWDELIDFFYQYNNNSDLTTCLDVDAHLWFLAFHNLLVNLDSPINFCHNFYLSQDATNRMVPIVWDLNMSFGGFTQDLAGSSGPGGGGSLSASSMRALSPLWHASSSYYPIISRVLNNSTYQKMYIAHMRTMIEENFSNNWYMTEGQTLQNLVATYVQNDPNFFYTYANFSSNLTSDVTAGSGGGGGGGQSGSVIGINSLMAQRVTSLLANSYFTGTVPILSGLSYQPAVPVAGEELTFALSTTNATAALLFYRQDPGQPYTQLTLYDDGTHNDGAANDGVYANSITIGSGDIQYYAWAQNSSQGAFLPARAAHEYYTLDVSTETGNVVINEINYSSADDFNTGDWVELYNPGDTAVDLSGWIFKDDDDSHNFTIPDGTVMAADSYMVLCYDLDAFSALHPEVTNIIGNFSFGLGSGGDATRLYDGNGALIDSLTYDDTDPWPSAPHGTGATLALLDPTYDNSLAASWTAGENHGTPGERNFEPAESAEIVINEINYNSSEDFDPGDWVELYNADDRDADLSGWIFRDDDDSHGFVVPDGTVLAAGAYLVLAADSTAFAACFSGVSNVVGYFDFGLGGNGDAVRLYTAAGVVVDSLTYDDSDPWPIAPDGTGATLELINPSYDNTLGASWQGSSLHGSPGQTNGTPVAASDNIMVPTRVSALVYPNPFNPTTSIRYTLTNAGPVNLSVFNVRGQRVQTLVNQKQDAGTHQVVFTGQNMASGVYFYRLNANGRAVTGKMVMLK